MTPARTRLAPSPTGYVHIGSLRTALYNYFLARQSGGKFVIRIEDTDRSRMVEGSIENLIEVFTPLGLQPDEGPLLVKGKLEYQGEFGPYVQSERLDIYKKYAQQLIDQGDAYYDFATKEQLEKVREEKRQLKQPMKYDRSQAEFDTDKALARIEAGEVAVVRLKVPEGETVFDDAIMGTIKFNNVEVDDQVLVKSDGFPTYHLAVVVDDHLMEITHMLRGQEWLSSTPKQILLYKMLGWDAPIFAHVPLLLNPDKTKLSKRQGDVAVEDYLRRGYLPEALINFVSTLGFNPTADREIYSVEELIELFDLSKVKKSGAVMNMEKLDWMNNQYIRELTQKDLAKRVVGFVQADTESDLVQRALFVERERVNRLDEFQEKITSYITEPSYDASVLVWRKADVADAVVQLEGILALLRDADEKIFSEKEAIEKEIKEYIATNGLSNGNVLWPLRVSLSGMERSAGPFEYVWALGRDEAVKRIEKALSLLA
jgi:glutamyl-tRNA synthetase